MDTGAMRPPPVIGSIPLAGTDPARLRAWYERAFGVVPDGDGFYRLGGVDLLIDGRDDIAARAAEPARVIINLNVPDARAAARHLDAMGVTWLAELEYRERHGPWFGTVIDPDGNYVQIIQITPAYWTARRERLGRGGGPLVAARVATRLPAQDLGRARRWHAEKLGREPAETRPSGLRCECGGGEFALFQSAGRPPGEHTRMSWQVADLDAAVAELRARGVAFEEYDVRGRGRWARSPRCPGTTRRRAGGASAPPGSTTARATCTASAGRSPRTPRGDTHFSILERFSRACPRWRPGEFDQAFRGRIRVRRIAGQPSRDRRISRGGAGHPAGGRCGERAGGERVSDAWPSGRVGTCRRGRDGAAAAPRARP